MSQGGFFCQVNLFTYNPFDLSKGKVTHTNGVPLGECFSGQLYAGLSPDSLAPVGTPVAFHDGPAAGYLNSGTINLPGIGPLETAYLRLRVWDSSAGPNFESAMSNGGSVGESTNFSFVWPYPEMPSLPPTNINFFPSFSLSAEYAPAIFQEPTNQTVACGSTATFQVIATGTPPLSYQWYHGTEPIPQATNDVLILSNVLESAAGTYSVLVTNNYGFTNSHDATLTVLIPDTDQDGMPDDWEILYGFNPADPSDAGQDPDGDGMNNLEECQAGTNPLSVPPLFVSVSRESEGVRLTLRGEPSVTYMVQYTDSLESDEWVDLISVILSTDQAIVVDIGAAGPSRWYRATLGGLTSANIVGYLDIPIHSGWSTLGVALSQSNYEITNLIPSPPDGTYVYKSETEWNVYDYEWEGGWIFPTMELPPGQPFYLESPSDWVWTQVGEVSNSPLFAMHPESQTVGSGTSVGFYQIALGWPPLRGYQWYFNGAPLLEQTAPMLWLLSVSPDQAGDYQIVVNNDFGAVTSVVARLTVTNPPQPPVITVQAQDQEVVVGGQAEFSVTATGTLPLSYQWFSETGLLAGATNTTLTITNIQPEQAISYWVVVSNQYGSTNSRAASLTVVEPPVIVLSPTNQTVLLGGTAILSVTASGTPLLTYQWQFDGTNLVNETNATLIVNNFQLWQGGDYRVVVSNAWGITNAQATLTVIPYTVIVEALSFTNAMGSSVDFQVRTVDPITGNELPNASGILWIYSAGTVRSIPVTTDGNGEATVSFTPLPRETGGYQYAASPPSATSPAPAGDFILVGMALNETKATQRLRIGVPAIHTVQLRNLTTNGLTGLTATVTGAPPNLQVEVNLSAQNGFTRTMNFLNDADLEGSATNEITYTITATSNNPSAGQFTILLSSAEGASANVVVDWAVAPPVPHLVATPPTLRRGMLRGDVTLLELKLANIGGAPAHNIQAMLPPVPWLSLVSSQWIPTLGMDETNVVILALKPAPDLPLGPGYDSYILFHAVETDLTVPFQFECVSAFQGSLRVVVVDEMTYVAEGAPRVANAYVAVREHWTGTNVADGITDLSGTILFTNLTEAYYEVDVIAADHGSFSSTVLITPETTNELVAFVSQELVNFIWRVEPSEESDSYQINLLADFEVVVPWPNLTVDPPGFNMCEFSYEPKQVNLSITNHSLIKATNLALFFPSNPVWEIKPLIDDIGELPAQSQVVVPVLVRQKAPSGNSSSRLDGYLHYEFLGSDIVFPRWHPIPVYNANAWDCIPAPPVVIRPAYTNMCEFTADETWVNFTVTSQSDLPVDDVRLSFDTHLQWQIEPSVTDIGTLAPHSSVVVPVLFRKTVSATSGPLELRGHLGYTATLQDGARSFSRSVLFVNPNPWDCVGLPLLKMQPNQIDLCDFASESQVVNFTITNQSLINADNIALSFSPHVRWQIDPLVSSFATLAPGDSLTVPVLFQRRSSAVDGPSRIVGSLEYQGTVEIETRSFSARVTLYNPNPWDCIPNPPVTIEPAVDLCALRALTNLVNFTIHNRSSVPAEGAVLTFGTHPQWEIFPVNIYYGALLPHTNFTQSVLFVRKFTQEDSSFTPSELAYEVTVDNQTRHFHAPVYLLDCYTSWPPPPPPPPNPGDHKNDPILIAKGTLLFQQKVTMTRNTFTATLDIINNSSTLPVSNLRVDLDLLDADNVSATHRFGIRTNLAGMTAIDGSGELAVRSAGRATWTLIPATNAAPLGATPYTVGGTVSYVQNGKTVTVRLYPVPIVVLPDPHLSLDYFWETVAYSDDPMTPYIEPTVPFAVGMIMHNAGPGTARSLQIEKSDLKVVHNPSGLLIDFQLTGAQVGGQPFDKPGLLLNLGDLGPNSNVEAVWWLTSSLQADFVKYESTFTHLNDLGQTNLSLIDCVRIHPLIHVVRDDRAGADLLPDFLAMDVPNPANLPDQLYLSDGSVEGVTSLTEGTVDGPASLSHSNVLLTLPVPPPLPSGWMYLRIPDPGNGFPLYSVKRSDGRELPQENFWTTHRIVYPRNGDPAYREDFLHLFDYDTTGSYTLFYNPNLYIVRHPGDLLVCTGSDAIFSVEAGGTPPIHYQWLKDGTNLIAQTSETLTVKNVQPGDLGSYSVVVYNSVGSLTSQIARLTICVPPRIIDHPSNLTNLVGTPATFQVMAEGTMPLSYQWSKDGQDLPGATGPTLVIPNVQTNDAGRYSVRLANIFGGTSSVAELIVVEPPCLEPIPEQAIDVGRLLILTNRSCDAHRKLTYSLCSGPEGSRVTPDGIFWWTPACYLGNRTYPICIKAVDEQYPIATIQSVFLVTVWECIEAGLGNTVMLSGSTSSVPVRLLSTTALTNMSFSVTYNVDRFDTNFSLMVNSPQVLTQQWRLLEPGRIELGFTLPADQVLHGPTNVGYLSFTSISNQASSLEWLRITNVTGLKPDGSKVANAFGSPGRVIVVGPWPYLEATLEPSNQVTLILYTVPGLTNVIQISTELLGTNANLAQWSNWKTNVQETLRDRIPVVQDPEKSALFFRTRRDE